MPNPHKAKGDALERAVHLIQDAILSTDPRLAGTQFSIETNRIESVQGVRHEIDVLVKTLPGSPYESVYLFECKNWKNPVGKNEVIIFAEKVRALGASRGFMVAREFTRDAEAQVRLDRRLNLLRCSDDFLSPLSFELTHTAHNPISIRITLKDRALPPSNLPEELNWKELVCLAHQVPIDIRAFALAHVEQMARQDQRDNAPKYNSESSHWQECATQFTFDPGEFRVNGRDLEWLTITATFMVEVRHIKLRSKFELRNQGRAYFFEPVRDDASGKQLEISIVHRL